MKSFKELGLSIEALRALDENGFKDPFPIQESTIPLILKGMDVIGQAHTGTGKTAAFSLPIVTRVKKNGPIQALILVPTRELAMQVTNEIRKLSKYSGIRALAVLSSWKKLNSSFLTKPIECLIWASSTT